jgi:hypothetical protein
MDLPVPARAMRHATAEELRKSAWLYPHFVSEAIPEAQHPRSAGRGARAEPPRRNLRRQQPAARDHRRPAVGDAFLQHLGEAGWSRDGVDAVVCTHLHVDHVGWNTMLESRKPPCSDCMPQRYAAGEAAGYGSRSGPAAACGRTYRSLHSETYSCAHSVHTTGRKAASADKSYRSITGGHRSDDPAASPNYP